MQAFAVSQDSLQDSIPCMHKQCSILAAKTKAFHKSYRGIYKRHCLLPHKNKLCNGIIQGQHRRQKAFGTGTKKAGQFHGTRGCRTVPDP